MQVWKSWIQDAYNAINESYTKKNKSKMFEYHFQKNLFTTECYQTYLKCAVNDSDKWYTGESMKSMF